MDLNEIYCFRKENTYLQNKKEFREAIMLYEDKMKMHPDATIGPRESEKHHPLEHTFCDGLYIRKITSPPGSLISSGIHKKEHSWFLMQGRMSILSEEGIKEIKAPASGITKPGTKRLIYTHNECIFTTVHATDCKDVDSVEKEICAADFNDKDIVSYDKKEAMLLKIDNTKKIIT